MVAKKEPTADLDSAYLLAGSIAELLQLHLKQVFLQMLDGMQVQLVCCTLGRYTDLVRLISPSINT